MKNLLMTIAGATFIGFGIVENALAATFTNVNVGLFTGGDINEGLDFDGDFQYAVNVRGTAVGKIRDANFTQDNVSGVTIRANNELLNWGGANDYGDTVNDNNLEIIMQSIRWSSNPNNVEVDLSNLIVGNTYKGQLLFAENCCNRGFDVLADGVNLVTDFSPIVSQGGLQNQSTFGVVVSFEFTAMDDVLNIVLDQPSTSFSDQNPILQGLTLERLVESQAVPEPKNILGLLLVGGISSAIKKKTKKAK